MTDRTAVPIDYLNVSPADIDTPVALFRKYRFLYVGTDAQLIDRKGTVAVDAVGTIERTGQRIWTFTTLHGDTWTISDSSGCNCTGSAIIPK